MIKYPIIKEYETKENKEKYIGKVFSSNEYGDFTILGAGGKSLNKDTLYVCEFNDTSFQVLVSGTNIVKGRLKDLYVPKVHGVGYIGSYEGKIDPVNNKCYKQWLKILDRCYEHKNERNPTYFDCDISKEWCNFGKFDEDYESILGFNEMKEHQDIDFHLDKDILVHGNKIYSLKTCCYVPVKINILFVNKQNTKSELPIGLSYNSIGRIRSTIFFNNKQEHLGYYPNTSEGIYQAQLKYWNRKLEIADTYLKEYPFLNKIIKDAVIAKVKTQALEEGITI